MSVGKFFAGFIIGGLVGGVMGVLLAPTAGEETRKKIGDTSSDLYQNTEHSIKEIQTKAAVAVDDIQKKGEELLVKIQEVIKEKSFN